jgi:hypothetical protein
MQSRTQPAPDQPGFAEARRANDRQKMGRRQPVNIASISLVQAAL